MKKTIVLLSILLITNWAKSQTIEYNSIQDLVVNLGDVRQGNEDFSSLLELKNLLADVEIVMLGEQSHGDATTYDTKIKLIKYLHQELGFDVLAFESGFYDCHKASQMIAEGEAVREAMGRSIFSLWSTTYDLEPLANYLERTNDSDRPLKLCGFDNQLTGKYSKNYFINDLTTYLKKMNPSILDTKEWEHYSESILLITSNRFKEFKKNNPEQDLEFTQLMMDKISQSMPDTEAEFWVQSLKSTHAYLSDMAIKTNLRDLQMADNLFWLKEKYPNRKIICWGATSHFLYNSKEVKMKSPLIRIIGGNYYSKQPMMGEYVKNKFQEKVYTIGFTAYQGESGLTRKRKIKEPKEKTLEYLLGQSEHDNFLLPLNDLDLSRYLSRPLANFYMKNPINKVMDAVIFNREMRRPKLDANFFLSIYPENKYIKPLVE